MKIYILMFSVVMMGYVNAQTTTMFVYEGKFNSSFGRSDNFRQFKGTLIVSGDRSLFTMKESGVHHASVQGNNIDLRPDSMFTVFKDVESNSLLFEFSDLNQRTHLFADTLFPMDWKTSEEQRSIGGIPCLKAVTQFKGRGYTAWYAPTITIPDGPWKLGGLPGLILEAYDDEDNWHMTFVSKQEVHGFDQDHFLTAMKKGTEGFPAFAAQVKKIFMRLEAALGAQSSANCVDCQTKSVVKIHSWEKID
jgi:GLPGLI family protein